GLKAPLALIGAVLPLPEGKPLTIKKNRLRGVESQGMLCSASELGMAEKSGGLLELPEDAPVGRDVREFLGLDDQVLELGITPNRGDCLSVAGLAREVSALTGMALSPPAIPARPAVHQEVRAVSLPAADACPRYAGRIIRNIDPAARTPLWMQEKLRRNGLRSRSPLVDVTNYVMLELGQPMHAFDLARLTGGIQARYSTEGETLTLLDDQAVTLSAGTLVIADEQQVLAMAGIMGGADSAVTASTRHVFLEAAHFRPEKLAGQARAYGLQTDSSYRFERGVAPDLPLKAMERATALILSICGGEPGPVVDCCADDQLIVPVQIGLRRARIGRLLGLQVADATVESILRQLGCQVEGRDDGWEVTVPLARFDLRMEADLIEELARIHGYDAIPDQLRPLPPRVTLGLESSVQPLALRKVMVGRGYQEAVTYSFVDPRIEAGLFGAPAVIELANPISSELSHMRTSIWSGLIPVLQYNLNRQQNRVRLFEIGPVFGRAEDGRISQQRCLSGLVTGLAAAEQWAQPARRVDFFDIKGDVEALLALASVHTFHFIPMAHPALHPGQSARIVTREQPVGWVGALHPQLEEKLGLGQPVYLFELTLEALGTRQVPKYQAVSRFPAIRRDLALVLDKTVLSSSLGEVIGRTAPAQLIGWNIFDVYAGKGVEEHQKSVALSLILQDFSRTLSDDEVNRIIDTIVAALHDATGATLR
nr:phenylalanine--tRNA ligase subunit beta [Thiolinea sp.]